MADEAQIQILKHFDSTLIERCRGLDRLVYDEKYQSTAEWENPQIAKNPRSRVLAHHLGELVGYVEYIPLTVAAFDQFLATRETVFDLLLTEQSIAQWSQSTPVDIYISSMVVRPDYQSKGISMVLLQGLLRALTELHDEGYLLGRIGATGVSVPGRRFVHTMLGIPYSHDVPGGVAGLGDAQATMRYLDEYLGW
jgi:GNAT superfamily N-acetyltransferase